MAYFLQCCVLCDIYTDIYVCVSLKWRLELLLATARVTGSHCHSTGGATLPSLGRVLLVCSEYKLHSTLF